MHLSLSRALEWLLGILCLAAPSTLAQQEPKELTSESFQSIVSLENVVAHLEKLEEFAMESADKNRLVGGQGHQQTLDYILGKLREHQSHYEIVLQPFELDVIARVDSELVIGGFEIPFLPIPQPPAMYNFSDVKLAIAPPLPDPGHCDEYDFPKAQDSILLLGPSFKTDHPCFEDIMLGILPDRTVKGIITTSKRMESEIIDDCGYLKWGPFPEGLKGFPLLAISPSWARNITQTVAEMEEPVIQKLFVDRKIERRTSINIIATTVAGDRDNILFLGAHSDSVRAGPGMNDNGSGTATILEIAMQLPQFNHTNTVRFGWWTAEEEGLLGSQHYVNGLTEEQLMKIRLYLNFDMLGSGNSIVGIYHGEASVRNSSDAGEIALAHGSALVEELFKDYFASQNQSSTAVEIGPRSDHASFQSRGIPTGGLMSSAHEQKTEEEAEIFGGTAGEPYDANYHLAGDKLANMTMWILDAHVQAVAHSVAVYAGSWEGFPERNASAFEERYWDGLSVRQKDEELDKLKEMWEGRRCHCRKDRFCTCKDPKAVDGTVRGHEFTGLIIQ